ncbi:MAG: DMT family transporter [Rhodobacteraceae bacterium]|nr:DMT family transporter [Paracoccaceae bacterium]
MPNRLSDDCKAILWVLLATAMFTVVYASGKFAGGSASPLQILFLRYLGGLLTLCTVALTSARPLLSYVSSTPVSHIVRAFFGAYGGAAIIYASANMPIVDATAIGLLSVVFMVAFGALALGEILQRKHYLGLVLCSLGAGLIIASRGAFQAFDASYLFPAAIALLGALFVGLEAVLIRTLSQSEDPMGILLHVNFFGLVLLSGPALYTWGAAGLIDNLPFVLLGPFAITAQYFVVRGYRIADIAVVGPIDFTWLVFAALLGLVFFGEVPAAGVVLGSGIIIFGGLVLSSKPGAAG